MIINTSLLLVALYTAIREQKEREIDYGFVYKTVYHTTLIELVEELETKDQEYTEII